MSETKNWGWLLPSSSPNLSSFVSKLRLNKRKHFWPASWRGRGSQWSFVTVYGQEYQVMVRKEHLDCLDRNIAYATRDRGIERCARQLADQPLLSQTPSW
jgi:hypothetical protein